MEVNKASRCRCLALQNEVASVASIVGGIPLPSIIDSPLEIVGVAPAQTTCSTVTGRDMRVGFGCPPHTVPRRDRLMYYAAPVFYKMHQYAPNLMF